ncbi:MAG: Rab family GTPase [Candidatus Hermodarchaeota archaeon]|nr:Rab family GTPase [Candidatus Hermodarchaeota archaeon]
MPCDKPLLAKVLIAGASKVGKTSLVNSLVFDGFTEVSPTIGVNFAQKLCHNDIGPVNLSIWDLSGQERFQCLMPRFCQGATGIVLVFDVTDPASLQSAGQWLTHIASYNPTPSEYAVVLAGNKLDQSPSILLEDIQTFCDQFQILDYIPCSAKTGENVKRVFQILCTRMQRSCVDFTETAPKATPTST